MLCSLKTTTVELCKLSCCYFDPGTFNNKLLLLLIYTKSSLHILFCIVREIHGHHQHLILTFLTFQFILNASYNDQNCLVPFVAPNHKSTHPHWWNLIHHTNDFILLLFDVYMNFELIPSHPSNDCKFKMDAVSLLSHPLYADNKLLAWFEITQMIPFSPWAN